MSLKEFNETPAENPNLTDGTNLAREKKAIQDSQDLEALRELRKAAWFKSYYVRRLREERDSLILDLLRDDPHEKVIEQRAVIRFIDKLLAMPEKDRVVKFGNLHPNQKMEPETD